MFPSSSSSDNSYSHQFQQYLYSSSYGLINNSDSTTTATTTSTTSIHHHHHMNMMNQPLTNHTLSSASAHPASTNPANDNMMNRYYRRDECAPPVMSKGGNNNLPRTTHQATAGKKDRHSKIVTAQGARDRRVRLSIDIAKKFFGLQDRLGFDKASKTLDWLLTKSKVAIEELEQQMHQQQQTGFAAPSAAANSLSSASETTAEIYGDYWESGHHHQHQQQQQQMMMMMMPAGSSTANKVKRETRAKARARARERTTRKKMCISTTTTSNHHQVSKTPPPHHHIKVDFDTDQQQICSSEMEKKLNHHSHVYGVLHHHLPMIPSKEAGPEENYSPCTMGNWDMAAATAVATGMSNYTRPAGSSSSNSMYAAMQSFSTQKVFQLRSQTWDYLRSINQL